MAHDQEQRVNIPRRRGLRPIRFLLDNSLLLVIGAVAALIWANVDPDTKDEHGNVEHGSYSEFVHYRIIGGEDPHHESPHHDKQDGGSAPHTDSHSQPSSAPQSSATGLKDEDNEGSQSLFGALYTRLIDRPVTDDHGNVHKHGITLHFLINDILMALFFAIAAKEVWESMLPGGALSNPRKAGMPLLATLGGMAGPATLFLAGAALLGEFTHLWKGWAVPCATDIAFSYMVARFIFRAGHPAIAFLLLLAIADDAGGLLIIAVAYPQKALSPMGLPFFVAAMLVAYLLRRQRVHNHWWYLLIPGALSWIAFDLTGVHAALGLVPIIPFMPHAHVDWGLYADDERFRHDTLNEFEHFWKYPVEVILGFFALANAGVVFGNVGNGTYLVLVGLLVGKPLGIGLFAYLGEKVFGFQRPEDMGYKHIVTVGLVAAIGFTVALFVSTAAFPAGSRELDELKMGALASIGAAGIAIIVARMLGVRRNEGDS